MAKIKEIVDSKTNITSTDKSDRGYPSVKEMRDSQARGNEGIGLNEQSYNESLVDFNQECDSPSDSSDDDSTPSEDVTPQPWMP